MMDGFVRKECRIDINRKYGYHRHQSQLKRLQRYNYMFPGLFPQVLGCGLEGNMSYYDMEIIDGINAYEFLTKVVPEHEIDEIIKFKSRLVKAMERIHGIGI